MKKPLRLCFVVNDFPLLSETFIASQIMGMIARGYDVTVVCDRVVKIPGVDPEAEPFRTMLRHTKPRWYMPHLTNWILDRLSGKLRGGIVAIADTLRDRQLNGYDVLIAHFSHTGARLARSHRLGIMKTPFATYFHGYDIGIPFKAGRMDRFGGLFRYGALFLPVCQFFSAILSGVGVDPVRIRIHRMGVDTKNIPFIEHVRSANRLEVITACRHVEKKGLRYAVEALGDLEKRRPDIQWHYTIVGDGPLKQTLETLVEQTGLTGRIEFTGPLANTVVHAMLSKADIFLQPSLTAENGDIEGCGVVLAESMASGLPVVSSFHSGIPELVTDGRTGLLAAEHDVKTLSRHIEWIADHPVESAEMAKRARAFVEAEFDNDRLNDQLCEIVETLYAAAS